MTKSTGFGKRVMRPSSFQMNKVRERHLEKRVVSIVAQPCRGDVDDILTITTLEGFVPHFEHWGNDLPRLLRRLASVKRDIDLFIAEHEDGYVHPPNETVLLRARSRLNELLPLPSAVEALADLPSFHRSGEDDKD